MLERVELLTLDEPVSAPAMIVYSTAPRRATTESGVRYFVKGPEPEVAFPELAGCLLARSVGLTVPSVAVCVFGSEALCGSQEAATIGRNVSPFLRSHVRLHNHDELYSAIVVDAWLANTDRNHGNIIVATPTGQPAHFVFIDFEKSKTLRPHGIIQSSSANPCEFWPTGELGSIIRLTKPLQPPSRMLTNIATFVDTVGAVEAVFEAVAARYRQVAWSDSSIEAVKRRGRRIVEHAEAVWNC